MPKLKLEDLAAIRERARRMRSLREGAGRVRITVHMGTCGIAAGARAILAAVLREIEERHLDDVLVTTSGCAGLCSREPMATVEIRGQPPVKYAELTEARVRKIFDDHVVGGRIPEELALAIGSERTH